MSGNPDYYKNPEFGGVCRVSYLLHQKPEIQDEYFIQTSCNKI